jgi:uncharacterized membrane protein
MENLKDIGNQKSALGLDGNITALIGYIIPLVALILLFMEKDNKFVRYHAVQSVLWAAAYIVSIIALSIIGIIVGVVFSQISTALATMVGFLLTLLSLGLLLIFFGGLIYAAIKAFQGNMFKLPVIGEMADKWSN